MGRSVVLVILTLLMALVMIPFTWTIGPLLEVRLAPVIEDVRVQPLEVTEDGLRVILTFTKNRGECEWLGVAWYSGLLRIRVDYGQDTQFFPRSRTAGDHQVGPWTLSNIKSLEGTRAEIYHQCHPLWIVHDTLYPPDMNRRYVMTRGVQ